jgi:hypothetical protein
VTKCRAGSPVCSNRIAIGHAICSPCSDWARARGKKFCTGCGTLRALSHFREPSGSHRRRRLCLDCKPIPGAFAPLAGETVAAKRESFIGRAQCEEAHDEAIRMLIRAGRS